MQRSRANIDIFEQLGEQLGGEVGKVFRKLMTLLYQSLATSEQSDA